MTHNITMTCQQRRKLESLTLMEGKVACIFSQKCWIYENWLWINWTWNPSQWKDFYYIALLVKSPYHYFFLFPCTAFFFPSTAFFFSFFFFAKTNEVTIIFWIAESYVHVTWRFQQWHLAYTGIAHQLLADSVNQEATLIITQSIQPFKGKSFLGSLFGIGSTRAED